MKNYFKISLYTFLLGAAFAITSCQKEEPFQEDINQEETLTASSAAVKLMEKTVSNDGSYDNIVDGASCFDIRFPYTVSVNGLELTVDSMKDLQTIEEILDAVDDNEDIMEIFFPITITMADYTEVTINDVHGLREIAEQCIEDGDDDDIECIDVIYPVTVFTYNPNFQQTANVSVESDMQLRRFLAGLEETDFISFDFPVSFEMFDGTKITVNSNSELANAIERAKKACDEDDDNDHNDDDFTEERLDSLLMECPWEVVKLERTDQVNSAEYARHILTFKEDGKVIADNRYGYSVEGEWSTKVSDFRVVLHIEFKDNSAFNETWYVYEIKEGKIKLFAGDDNKIVLEMACDYDPEICTLDAIRERLGDCRWKIAYEDGTFFEDLNIDFSNMNMHVHNPNDTVVDEGNWSISEEAITFNDLSMTLSNYSGNWVIVECTLERFKLKRGDEIIVLVKECK